MIDEKKLIERFWKRHREVQNNDDDYSNEEAEIICAEICNVISIIDEQPKTDWIPCEVEMPKENIEVWVTVEEFDGSCYTQASWLQDGQWVIKKTPLEPKVIAWMPKPKPYKKEGAE